MLNGSCGCGRITYEVDGPLLDPVNYCHCWRCRKQSGSSFSTTAGLRMADFTIIQGEHLLSRWESSPGTYRFFASCCGSPIYKLSDSEPGQLRLRLGTLDTDPSIAVTDHIMLGSKAPWVEIHDNLQHTPGGPPFGQRD